MRRPLPCAPFLLEPKVQGASSMSPATPSPSLPRPGQARRARGALAVVASYTAAIACTALLFLAWRVHVYHATFASREFFWLGDVHVHDDAIGFKMRPGRRGLAVLNHGILDPARRIPVRTDPLGFRVPLDRDSTVVQAGGIAAIGCSCTFAHGVAAESSYVNLAGELLGVPAYNLGVCGYSAVTSLLLLEENLGRLRPRFVVYGFGNFHLERSGRPRSDGILFQASAACDARGCRIEPPRFSNGRSFGLVPRIEALYYEPKLAGRPTPLDLQRVRAVMPLAIQDLGRALNPRYLSLRSATHALPETTFCRFLVGRLHDDCRRSGARCVVLWFPASFGERPLPGLLAAVEELHGAEDFTFVDCSPRLFAGVRDAAEYGARWQVPRDGHPNRFMHLEMARVLADALGPRVGGPANSTASPGNRRE